MTSPRPARRAALAGFAALAVLALSSSARAQELTEVPVPQIQDNSFLMEEAYNQEPGVVQHISTFSRARGGGWLYTFTQEWPVTGIRHQLSYALPLAHDPSLPASRTGIGDILLNYRLQLAGDGESRLAVAPRLSVLLPTGSFAGGRGAGGVGLQTNVALSYLVAPRLAAHLNLGATLIPSAEAPLGAHATTVTPNAGASVVWLLSPRVNLLVEGIWLDQATATGPGTKARSSTWLLNPGARVAFNTAGSLQIVPGIAYTVDLTDGASDVLFLYLSFEHRFQRAPVH